MSAEGDNDNVVLKGSKKTSETRSQIHSANSWETADLGDKQRNEKFLRLMGAAKKEHHGKIVIGDHKTAAKRERLEEQHLAEELEEQYEHSLDYTLAGGRRGHLGLGYHPEASDKPEVSQDESVVEKEQEDEGEGEIPSEQSSNEENSSAAEDETADISDKEDVEKCTNVEHKRQSVSSDSEPEAKKMKFVKGSS